jgi:predicted Zn-dependent protease
VTTTNGTSGGGVSRVVRPQELAEQALKLSRADDCVVLVNETSGANIRWADNTLTTNGVSTGQQVTVISMVGGSGGVAVGAVGRGGVDADTLADLVAASEAAARGNEPAEDARALLTLDEVTDVDAGDWDAEPVRTDIGIYTDVAPALGDAFRTARAAGRRLYGFANHETVTTYLATSSGLRLRTDQRQGKLELNAKSAAERGSAWHGVSTLDFTDVDVAAIERRLAHRLRWAERSVDLPAGRYEALLPPAAVADLYIYLHWTSSGRDAHEGRSAFSRPGGGTRVGERLAGDGVPLTMYSDPAYPGLACAPFVVAPVSGDSVSVFDNGLPQRRVDWLRDGTLSALITSRYTAALTGLPVSPAASNLIIEGPTDRPATDLDQMVAGTERGLLLTCLWYIREVDPQTLLLTGLTRDGVYLVEHGEVVGAVNNFRFNESPIDMLTRVQAHGPTERTLSREWAEYYTRTAMPALRVADFNMSSVSQAS